MKKNKESNLILTVGLFLSVLMLILSVALITPATVTASADITLEGTL